MQKQDREITLDELRDRLRRGRELFITDDGRVVDEAEQRAEDAPVHAGPARRNATRLRDEEFASDDTVRLTRTAHAELLAEIARTPPNTETGVVLVGWPDRGIITRCIAAGDRSHRSAARFTRAASDVQRQLDDAVGRGDGVYLGEAHLHPSHFDRPSGTDVATMLRIVDDEAYSAPRVFLGIAVRQPSVRS